MDPILSVRSAETVNVSIGYTMEFDFSADCTAGRSILAYGIGLAGFGVNYEPDYTWLGLLNISLVPYLVGSKVYATASAVFTDYDYDFGETVNPPDCFVQATALALIGTAMPDGKVVLGNQHGVANGQGPAGIPIGQNLSHWGYVAGLSFAAVNTAGTYVGGPSYSVTSSVDDQGTMSLTAHAATPSGETSGALDLLALSLPDSVCNYEVQLLNIPFQRQPLYQGMSGNFAATFNPPAGKSVVNVGILQQGVDIVYPSNSYVYAIQASLSGLSLASPTVTGTYLLNMHDGGATEGSRIESPSTASIYAIAQFG